MNSEPETTRGTAAESWFRTTHWSVVLEAGDGDSPLAADALAKLCQVYWYPLYVFVRRRGHTPEDAQDLVQGFFARMLEKNYFKQADQDKGSFRSFLLTALKRFMANEWDRANRIKRGGGQQLLSLDVDQTETRYSSDRADDLTPEKAFERRWALTLLGQVLERLKAESYAAGKAQLFDELQVFLSGESDENSHAEAEQKLGMTADGLRSSIYRMRQRFRELLRIEIGHTVASSGAIDEEIRHLFAVLS